MNLAVNDQRQCIIGNPEIFAAGELTPVVISGLSSPDVASMELGLFDQIGNMLALCATFAVSGSTWTGNLDCRTSIIQNEMLNHVPSYHLPVYIVLIDKFRIWFSQDAMMVNNPFIIASPSPDPMQTYLTKEMFAALPSTITNFGQVADAVQGILNVVKS